ncbi:MAG: glycosyltransferase family 2 protein [Chloroflexi bacterium]|nr:glycosyltransferase family 2 protein [Chloroflexota bacterium]
MPLVSIIVPCYNEQATIRLLLDAIRCQTMPNSDMEVIIADGLSTDRTRDIIAEYQSEHPDLAICLVDNPRRIIPAALNCALRAARGEYIIRLDAHSVPAQDYVERCVESLKMARGENVGGVWDIRPQGSGLVQQAIAIAAAHPFGAGDARYRYTSESGYVDTVPFGAFRREVFEQFGYFDETLLSNEDYEYNARLRQAGGRIWLDPKIRSTYFARSSLGALAKQYWRYGYWKRRMLQQYPKTLRWRQALPPVFVLSLLVLAIAGIAAGGAWVGALVRLLFVVELCAYFLVLAAGSIKPAQRHNDFRLVLAVPVAIATMHFSWGAGFLWSALTAPFWKIKSSKS